MPLYFEYIEIFISISLISMVSVWIRISSSEKWDIEMNCRCWLHVPSWRAQWWPVTTLSCENWSQLSIVIIWSPADQSVPAAALAFLLHYTAAGISPDRQTPAPLAILSTKCLSFFIIMAVLVKFLPRKVVHVWYCTKTDTPLDIVLDPSITEMQKQSNIQLQRTDRALWLERLSVHWAATSCLHPHSFTALTITELTKLSGEQEDHLEN